MHRSVVDSDAESLPAGEWMRLHVQALFQLDHAGRLLTLNQPGGGAAPRFLIGWTAEGNFWWFRNDLDPVLVADLDAVCRAQSTGLEAGSDSRVADLFLAHLARQAPVGKIWMGPAFRFPPHLPCAGAAVPITLDNATTLSPYMEAWLGDLASGAPMAAVLEDGQAVSVCCSVRITPEAHEAGVETHPEFRGRGYAARAVGGWAAIVRGMNRLPLYSTSWTNQASRAVAGKLGLIQFGSDLHIT